MSGTRTTLDPALVQALAKRMVNPSAMLRDAEYVAFNQFVGTWTSAGTDSSGFPSAPGGDVNGWNSLCRTNWFNGRFLTAEALRRQDTYFDYRTRLDAQAQMPGVAYGLGLTPGGPYAGDLNHMPYTRAGLDLTKGFPANEPIMLLPGLAFDMIGRPILVPANFTFTLAQLITLLHSKPRRVVGGGTQFSPCVCLAPDPEGPTGGSAGGRMGGPYLLVIEAAEQPNGEAQVYGSVCSDNQPITCQSDAWCAGFGLSLVRFPVEVPVEQDKSLTSWDLRGILSAYFFDASEHSLINRWDPTFVTDDGFCLGVGSGRDDTGAVALAMVYLGTDSSALWIDSWIPRRSIVATPGEDWHRTRFGAPPRAAAWARIHQFQCMLAESYAIEPIRGERNAINPEMIGSGGVSVTNRNLLARGFRHIPPIGFLPIDPLIARLETTAPADVGDPGWDVLVNKKAAQFGAVSGFVLAANRQARTWFENTNVLTYTVVALHDDDILQDLAAVFDKDPVQLDRMPDFSNELLDGWLATSFGKNPGEMDVLLRTIAQGLIEIRLDDFVNRRVEVVKLIVPLQGFYRQHPILGQVAGDALNQAPNWGAMPTGNPAFMQAANLADVAERTGLKMLPRHFVVYVKQRMVLLDVVFMLLESMALTYSGFMKSAPAQAAGQSDNKMFIRTQAMRSQYMTQPVEQRALSGAALQDPQVQFAISRIVTAASPDLSVTGRADTFLARVKTVDDSLVHTIPDATARRSEAIDRVADSYAASHPGFQFVQLLAATQAPDVTEAMIQALGRGAQATDGLAIAPTTTAFESAMKAGPPIFASADAAHVYAEVQAVNANQPVSTLLPGATADLTVAEMLAKSPKEATALLGGARNFTRFGSAVANQAKTASDAAVGIVAAPPPGLAVRLQAALRQAGNDLPKAIDAVRTAESTDAVTKTYLEHASVILARLGPGAGNILLPILTRRV